MRELGVGLVFWPALAPLFQAGTETVGVLELEPQGFWEKVRDDGGWAYRANHRLLDQVAALPQPTLLHGVGQPIGGTTPDPVEHVPLLREMVDLLDPAWVSEHLSLNRGRGPRGVREAGFLLPPRQSPSGARVAAEGIHRYGQALGRPVAFETNVNYLRPRADETDDGDFVGAVALGADCGILLDLHNLWCNERNGRARTADVLARLPLDRVWEVHLAGGMPLDGYWLDAHSGAVPAALLDLAAELIPSLPAVGALVFEILPEHLDTIGLDGVQLQLDALRDLWALRAPRRVRAADAAVGLAARPSEQDVAEVRCWEDALLAAVSRRPIEPARFRDLADDPGVAVLQQLVGDFRRAHLARTLRYTVTSLLLGLGARETHALLGTFFAEQDPDPYAAVEAHHFCCFLRNRRAVLERVPYLAQVLTFEHALVRASVFGSSTEMEWGVDPTSLFAALDSARAPGDLPPVPSRMLIA